MLKAGLFTAFENEKTTCSEPLHSCSCHSSGECLLFSNFNLHLESFVTEFCSIQKLNARQKLRYKFFRFREYQRQDEQCARSNLSYDLKIPPKMKQLSRNSQARKLPQIQAQLMKNMESKKAESEMFQKSKPRIKEANQKMQQQRDEQIKTVWINSKGSVKLPGQYKLFFLCFC